MIKLGERLLKIANKIEDGESVLDIGTDHGYLPLYLYEKGKCNKLILSDISEGSLKKAEEDAKTYFPEVEFDLRIGDGLKVVKPKEVDTVVIAGMGGNLIKDILDFDLNKSWTFEKYIFEPRRHIGRLRHYLLYHSFKIVDEDLAREGDYIWPIITAVPREIAVPNGTDEDDIEFEYPRSLVEFRNELTEEYLNKAFNIEVMKLESKKMGSSTSELELRRQSYRVEYMEYLLGLL